MTRRPDEGYKVRSRLQNRPSLRGRIAAALVVVAAAAWAAATLTPGPPATADTTGRPTTGTSLRPGETVTPTLPPAIEVREGAPLVALPIVLRGPNPAQPGDASQRGGGHHLAWLVPTIGTVRSEPSPSWAQWVFLVGVRGTRCVCIEAAGVTAAGGVLHILDDDPAGLPLRDFVVTDWPPTPEADSLLFDAALDPNGEAVHRATATHGKGGWTVSFERVDQSRSSDTIIVGTVSDADVGEALVRELRVWISPDGAHARIRLGTSRTAPAPPTSGPARAWTWLVPIVDGIPTAPTSVPEADDGREEVRCIVEGWATPADFASVCTGFTLESGEVSTRIASQSVDGIVARVDIPVPPGFGFDTSAWIIDGSAGIAYGYDNGTNHAYRVAIPSLAVRERELPQPTEPGAFQPEAARPETAGNRTIWQGGSAGSLLSTPIVGSPDGRLLYVAGFSPQATAPGRIGASSTGIWMLDAATLDVVDHWSPEGEYQWLGLTPDGQFVMAFGGPSISELQALGNHGPMLVFHDTTSGAAVLIIRSAVTQLGSEPYFLVPAPAL